MRNSGWGPRRRVSFAGRIEGTIDRGQALRDAASARGKTLVSCSADLTAEENEVRKSENHLCVYISEPRRLWRDDFGETLGFSLINLSQEVLRRTNFLSSSTLTRNSLPRIL